MRYPSLLILAAAVASCAPHPVAGQEKQTPAPTLPALTAVLGKDTTSDELKAIHKAAGAAPKEDVIIARDWFYHSWKELGLSLRFGKGKVVFIFLYADGVDKFKQYPGELPKKLSFTDTLTDVERKLGAPDSVSNNTGSVIATYESLGVRVDYVSKDLDDKKNRIKSIGLFHPKQ